MVLLILGSGTSFGISGFMVMSSSNSNDIGDLMMVEASFSIIAFILTVLLLKNKPVLMSNQNTDQNIDQITDQNIDQNIDQNTEKNTYQNTDQNEHKVKNDIVNDTTKNRNNNIASDLKTLFANKNYAFLLISNSIAYGIANYLSIALETITSKFGFSSQEISIFGICVIIFGLIGCGICSYLSAINRKYKKICLITMIATLVFTLTIYFIMKAQIFYLSVINSCLLGIFLMPVLPLSLELGCEITVPVRVMISSGFLNCCGGLFSIIPLVIAYGFDNQPLPCFMIIIISETIAIFFMALVKENSISIIENSPKTRVIS